MFFYLSKVFYFLIQPINWLIALLLFAWLTKNQRRRKIALMTAAIGVVFLTNPFIFNVLIKNWEVQTDPPSVILNDYDVAILMGGNQPPDVRLQDGGGEFSIQTSRVFDALELYRKGRIKKLILLNGPLHLGEKVSEQVNHTRDFLLRVGVPEQDLIVLTESRNTHEHAYVVSKYLEVNMPGAKCLLLTSAWNMRRASGCFLKENVNITEVSTEYFSQTGTYGLYDTVLPDSLGFFKWEFFIKEVIGYLAYWLQGYL
jgi:uncharacterized SAM-binding protein YcdF (DUF218 family)